MPFASRIVTGLAIAFALAGGSGAAEPEHGHEAQRPAPPHAEPHPGPRGYERAPEPRGWNARPATVDVNSYHHNFQAQRSFRIGPYRRPAGWVSHHWAYGQVLPRAYWAPQYLISDYWLFALEVPPVGYEWIRDDDDALLINVATGEILQAEYGVFG
jgi:Ni/Co efflux regulator RcnB